MAYETGKHYEGPFHLSSGPEGTTLTNVNTGQVMPGSDEKSREREKRLQEIRQRAAIYDADDAAQKKKYDALIEEQKLADINKKAGSVASKEEWIKAWAEKQTGIGKKEIGRESHSDPSPLLTDKIATLPADSNERRNAENLFLTLKGEGSNTGYGLDALNRESYKEVKRLTKHSEMLQQGIEEPLPEVENLAGEENGQVVSNVQSWKAPVKNAVKPVSDAMGSHADTSSSVVKSPTGPDQQLPTAVNATVDRMSPQIVNEANLAAKSVQLDGMQHMPSKMAGSIRHLATAADKNLSVPFEIASDVYNGLMGVMNEASNLTDAVMANITNYGISAAGGLVDGLFPANNLNKMLGPISKLTSETGNLTQLLGGFSAISSITNTIGSIGSSLSAALRDPAKLGKLLAAGAAIADIIGGLAGKDSCHAKQLGLKGNKLGKILGKIQGAEAKLNNALNKVSQLAGIIGSLEHLAGNVGKLGIGLGNLGSIIGKGIPKALGSLTKNLRNPGQLIAGLLPHNLAEAHELLHKLCNLGMVGNPGFSVGTLMDGLQDLAFTKAMETHASHASIISPLFNKEYTPVGSYAQEDILNFFESSKFVNGAQGNKGITMHGPGGTAPQKAFNNGVGDPNDAIPEPYSSMSHDQKMASLAQKNAQAEAELKKNLTPAQYTSYKQQTQHW